MWYKAFTAGMRGVGGMVYKEDEATIDPSWRPDPGHPSGVSFCDTPLSTWLHVPHTTYRDVRRVTPIGEVLAVRGHRHRAEGVVVGASMTLEELALHADDEYACAAPHGVVWGRGTQTVFLFGTSCGRLSESCTAYAHDDSVVYADDESVVYAADRCRVIAGGRSRVYSWNHRGSVSVFEGGSVSPGPQTKAERLEEGGGLVLPVGQSFAQGVWEGMEGRVSAFLSHAPSIFDPDN